LGGSPERRTTRGKSEKSTGERFKEAAKLTKGKGLKEENWDTGQRKSHEAVREVCQKRSGVVAIDNGKRKKLGAGAALTSVTPCWTFEKIGWKPI